MRQVSGLQVVECKYCYNKWTVEMRDGQPRFCSQVREYRQPRDVDLYHRSGLYERLGVPVERYEVERERYPDRPVYAAITRDFSDGVCRARINVKEPVLDHWSDLLPAPQETLDLTVYPDGKREIRLAAYDHFSPPRYDGLPLAYCVREGHKERATLSFECKADECFAGTGEAAFIERRQLDYWE